MINVSIADVPCPKCGATMSIHVADRHHYLTCMECQYVATIEKDSSQLVDVINYLTGEIVISENIRRKRGY